MKGFILAAGFGQRMQPLTDSLPKPLLTVGRLPLIAYAVKLLSFHGIVDIVINLHHLADTIKEALGDGSAYGVNITYSVESEILGTGGGLKRMHAFLNETFVVVNSDILFDLDLAAVLKKHRAEQALATMVLRSGEKSLASRSIEIDDLGRVRRILGQAPGVEDAASLPPLTAFMFTGVHVLEPRFLEYIAPDVHSCVVRYGYLQALKNDERLMGFVTSDLWLDAGEPQAYFETNKRALSGGLHLRHTDPMEGYALTPKRDVEDAVRLGEKVTLAPNTYLKGPLAIDDGVQMGPDTRVGPNCIVGRDVVIGRGASLSETIVLPGAVIEADAQLERAVVGRKAVLLIGS